MPNKELWELFDTITSAWYGKMMYGVQYDGRVYSRHTGLIMSFEQAVEEFCEIIGEGM